LVYLNGLTFQRHLISWRGLAGFDLNIGEAGQARSIVSWRLTEEGDDSCRLAISVYPHLMRQVPGPVSFPFDELWLRPRLTAYLDSVTRGLRQYVETGQQVQKMAFGAHPWFC
jgi:hypothetical protein